MAIIAARYDMSHTSFLVMPLLLFHFIFDTTITMARRGLAGENIAMAHRTHLYQLLVRMGMSHASVTGSYCLLALVQGFAALWMVQIVGEARLWVFVPFVVVYSLAAYIITMKAKNKRLLTPI